MANQGYPFPFDKLNLLGGRCRVLYAPLTQAIPEDISDVIQMNGGYAAQGGWIDIGATKESFSYTRGFETTGWEIQQLPGNVIEEVTNITRTISVSAAEFRSSVLQIIENAPDVDMVGASPGGSGSGDEVNAQEIIKFGSFSSLERYRFAFISQRAKASGIVVDNDGERGRFVMGTLYEAQLSADDATIEQTKGELSAAGVTFTSFPAEGEPTGQEYGLWALETAGDLAGSGS